ncbi:MAG: hypothetical protein KIT14_01390 [bacterium]|nr:hypothetical protein [bacterium]
MQEAASTPAAATEARAPEAPDPIARLLEARHAEPARRLAAAVVLQALDDLALGRRRGTTRLAEPRAIRQHGVVRRAAAWFASDARDWPFAFVSLCDALELDPVRIRRLLGITPLREGGTRWSSPPEGGRPGTAAPVAQGRARRGALHVVLRDR